MTLLGQNVNSYGRDLPRPDSGFVRRAARAAGRDRRHPANPLHEPPSEGHARRRDPRPRRASLAVRAHPSAASVRIERGAQAHAPHLHPRALSGSGGDDPRARPRLRADHRHHRRLPRRERGGLRTDAERWPRTSPTTARSPSSTPRAGEPRPPRCPTRSRTKSRSSGWSGCVEVIQRRALERAQRFVGRTLEVLVEGPSRTDPSRLRGRSRHNKVVNFSGLARRGGVRRGRGHGGDEPDAVRARADPQPRRFRLAIAADGPAPRGRWPGRHAHIDSRRRQMRTCVRALEQPQPRGRQRARLPGYRDGAVVRHFEAPDAVKTRFYEVQAKSILNRVPEASRMPFRWTVNPYRGCSHACVYCFARPTHKYLDFDAGRGLRAGDRRQGQRPRAAASRARAPVLGGRARRSGHQHRSLPVGGGPLPADARNLGGAARRRQPVLGPDQVAAAAARSAVDEGDRGPDGVQRRPVDPHRRREGVAGHRASHAEPARPGSRRLRSSPAPGIRTGVLVAPLMPGINDAPEQLAPILEQAAAAGAAYITGIALHLRGDVRGLFFDWLQDNRPDLVPRYKRLYGRGAYAPPEERKRLGRLLKGPDLTAGTADARYVSAPGRIPAARAGARSDKPVLRKS